MPTPPPWYSVRVRTYSTRCYYVGVPYILVQYCTVYIYIIPTGILRYTIASTVLKFYLSKNLDRVENDSILRIIYLAYDLWSCTISMQGSRLNRNFFEIRDRKRPPSGSPDQSIYHFRGRLQQKRKHGCQASRNQILRKRR